MAGCFDCGREDCPRTVYGERASFEGIEDCLARTSAIAREARAAEKQARAAVLATGRDPRWAAVYAWLDDHRDVEFKRVSDMNGALEIRIIAVRRDLEELKVLLAAVQVNHRHDCPMRHPDQKVDRVCSLGVLHIGAEPKCDCFADQTERQLVDARVRLDRIIVAQ